MLYFPWNYLEVAIPNHFHKTYPGHWVIFLDNDFAAALDLYLIFLGNEVEPI